MAKVSVIYKNNNGSGLSRIFEKDGFTEINFGDEIDLSLQKLKINNVPFDEIFDLFLYLKKNRFKKGIYVICVNIKDLFGEEEHEILKKNRINLNLIN